MTSSRLLLRHFTYICPSCQRHLSTRGFVTTSYLASGHSRWSKIKHDKAKADNVKNKQRSVYSHEIALATKLFGPDPGSNPRLALAVQNAKKSGFPKASIEAAINRGQGISESGAKLESVTVEAMIPPSVAVVIDCETDNKLRTLADVRLVVKQHGGQATPTGYLFNRRGRVAVGKNDDTTLDDIMEPVLEAGAIDIEEDDDGGYVIFTEPTAVNEVSEALMKQLKLEIQASEIIYDAIDKVEIASDEEAEKLQSLIEKLKDTSGVQDVYVNVA